MASWAMSCGSALGLRLRRYDMDSWECDKRIQSAWILESVFEVFMDMLVVDFADLSYLIVYCILN